MYDYIITTHLPSFYKINLYNELNKKLKIFVIFIAPQSIERTKDFIDLNCTFDYKIINNTNLENRNIVKSAISLKNLLSHLNYKYIIIGGWDLIEFRMLILIGNRTKNMLILESTVLESQTNGIKGLIKKIFLSRISMVFASGNLHVQLLNKLKYKGSIKITKGVGIINKPKREITRKKYTKDFLFLGRLSPEKNLEMLINVFNDLPEYKLTIIGKGPLHNELQGLSNRNIHFIDHTDNKKLPTIFQKNNILILPSKSEAWGLVVEEALYFSLPVIVSKNCGASELIQDNKNGFIVDPNSFEDIKKTILQINPEMYDSLVEGVQKFSIDEKDREQINAYL